MVVKTSVSYTIMIQSTEIDMTEITDKKFREWVWQLSRDFAGAIEKLVNVMDSQIKAMDGLASVIEKNIGTCNEHSMQTTEITGWLEYGSEGGLEEVYKLRCTRCGREYWEEV